MQVSRIRKYGRHMDKQVFFLHRQFNDFEAYCESARHWDLDYYQLDRGGFSSERLMFGNSTTIFSNVRMGRRMLQRGATPSGLITFGVLANPNISIHWRNHDIVGDKLLIFPPGGELYSITQPDFDVFALSLAEATLDRTCHSLELPDFRNLIDGNDVFNCQPQSMRLLRKWLQKTALGLVDSANSAGGSVQLQQLEEELAYRLITTLAESRGYVQKPVMRKRDHALETTVNHIVESARPVISVQELCAIANASERTLQYAFHERFGQSPKAFTLIYRLNNVRKMLSRADPDIDRIYEIAGHYGFFHMGQFTTDYKYLFGELPSATLRQK